ncbi:MAG: hypothetical protein M3Q55_02650 [Acidobacteriota bacterium]|nr:hypothetical protein [Acidobacteriota bacterium]
MTSPRFITLTEIAVDRCYDLSDPRALSNCREWLRRKGLRSTGGGRFNRAQYLAVMDRVERTPKAKATAAQQQARALNLSRGRLQLLRSRVSRQSVRDVHAGSVADADAARRGNTVAEAGR